MNKETGKPCPMISDEVYDIVMKNSEVCSVAANFFSSLYIKYFILPVCSDNYTTVQKMDAKASAFLLYLFFRN